MKYSAKKLEISDRIVEKVGFRGHQGASLYLNRLSTATLKWLEEGIDRLQNSIPLIEDSPIREVFVGTIDKEASKLAEKYNRCSTKKIIAIKE